jgi:hypothetical protein
MKLLAVGLVGLALLGVASASCPNHCSGNGKCIADDKCSCFIRYTGADCSQRKCKENVAWADGSDSDAHEYYECSNKGTCDRATGECQCYPGYGGAACQRSECPNACSGHGTCEYLTDLSGGYTSTMWDVNKIQGCKCDGGWSGFDCSLRMCPRGDDPLTPCPPAGSSASDGQCDGQIWTITLTFATSLAADLAGDNDYVHWRVQDEYGEWHKSRAFYLDSKADSATRTENAAKNALLDMNFMTSLAASEVTFTDTAAAVLTIAIYLDNPARVNMIMIDTQPCTAAGCQPMQNGIDGTLSSQTYTITSATSGASTYLFPDVETAVCSNRGVCDESTGKCQCFEGHTGLACEEQTILV